MKQIIRAAVLMLFVLIVAPAQQETDNRGPDRFAASVIEQKGACYVRDNKAGKPRPLKSGDRLQAGQELQCEAKAYLRIRFSSSGADKEIEAIHPTWYEIGNVPGSTAKESGARAGRKKGNDPPLATEPTGTPSPQRPSELAGSGGPTVQTHASGELADAELFWKGQQKYFLIVAASKTAGASNDSPFTKVDAQRISQALTKLGYQKLELLSDELATHDNFVTQLQKIRNLPPNALVIVYYSGHAVTDPQGKDLFLQLYGQKQLGDQFGLSVSSLVDSARGATYKGALAIILDTCYSGRGSSTSKLSLRETENTVIFASSAFYQRSYSKVLPSGIEMSAFTYYLLQGLESDWAQVDGDADGIILYNDLQIYIGNKLLEQSRERGILGPMQPQLLSQSPKIWAAYDFTKARNFETQQLQNLRLERTVQVQNPEKVTELLPTPLRPGAPAYHRALKALKEERFDEAWKLFEEAEKEQWVSPAEIYWARALLKSAQGELGNARDWCEKALAVSRQQNVELLELTALTNYTVGNWVRAEQQFKQVIDLLGEENEPEMILSLMSLVMLKTISGNTVEAEIYIGRLRSFDPKVMEEKEAGSSQILPFLELLLDVFRGKNERASRRLAELRQNLALAKGEMLRAFRPILHLADAVLNTQDADASKVTSLVNDVFKQWEEAIQKRKVNNILLLLNQLQVIADGSADRQFLRTNDVESRLRRTVELARQHKSERQKITVEGVGETEIANSEEQSAIESANLLTGAAVIYEARKEIQEAEKLFREAISLEEQNTKSPYQDLNSIIRLAGLYVDSERRAEAENVYRKALTRFVGQGGEQSLEALTIQNQLGELCESRGSWDQAEQSYQFVARMSQSKFGADSIVAIAAQEKLATFLFQRGRYAAAIPLLEPVVRWFERRQQTEALLVEVSHLKSDYFQLAKSYYKVGRYDEAESAFHKGSDIISANEDADPLRKSDCLVWQWIAADALKKPEEAKRIYHDLIQLIQLELAQFHPNGFIGTKLLDFASRFRDSGEYPKADELLRVALTVQEKAYGAQSLETAYVWTDLGDLDISRGQYRNAIVSLKTAQRISEKQSPSPTFWLSYVEYRIGFANYSQLDFEEARLHLTRSAERLQQARDSDNFARRQLGRVERLLGHLEAAKEIMKSVLYEREKAKPADPSGIFFALLELTSISRLQGDREEANQWLTRAQKASEGVDPVERPARWSDLDYEKGMAAFGKGKTKEAVELLRVAIDKDERTPQMDQPLLLEYMRDYVRVLRQLGKKEEAAAIEQRANQIRGRLKD